MFYNNYLNDIYQEILYSNYSEEYLESFNEQNFIEVYNLLKEYGFYYIEDIIINYIELFGIDVKYVRLALENMKNTLTKDFIKIIGSDMTLVNNIIKLALSYSNNEV